MLSAPQNQPVIGSGSHRERVGFVISQGEYARSVSRQELASHVALAYLFGAAISQDSPGSYCPLPQGFATQVRLTRSHIWLEAQLALVMQPTQFPSPSHTPCGHLVLARAADCMQLPAPVHVAVEQASRGSHAVVVSSCPSELQVRTDVPEQRFTPGLQVLQRPLVASQSPAPQGSSLVNAEPSSLQVRSVPSFPHCLVLGMHNIGVQAPAVSLQSIGESQVALTVYCPLSEHSRSSAPSQRNVFGMHTAHFL